MRKWKKYRRRPFWSIISSKGFEHHLHQLTDASMNEIRKPHRLAVFCQNVFVTVRIRIVFLVFLLCFYPAFSYTRTLGYFDGSLSQKTCRFKGKYSVSNLLVQYATLITLFPLLSFPLIRHYVLLDPWFPNYTLFWNSPVYSLTSAPGLEKYELRSSLHSLKKKACQTNSGKIYFLNETLWTWRLCN